MKVVKLVDRELSGVEKETVQRFEYYFENKTQFALIGDHTIIMLSDETGSDLQKTIQKTIEEAKAAVDNVLSAHPDFTSYIMDDGYGIVVMGKWEIIGVSSKELSDEENEKKKVSLKTSLSVRAEMLENCEKFSTIALVLFE